MKVKRRVENLTVKLNIQNLDYGDPAPPLMANRWEMMETVTNFIFGHSKITADGDGSHEIKILSIFGRKAVTN